MNIDVDSTIKKFTEAIESPKGKKLLDNMVNELFQGQKISEQRLSTIHKLHGNNINAFIDMVYDRYNSDKYLSRHRHKQEPPYRLYWILLDYAEKYGDKCDASEYGIPDMFTAEMYRLGDYLFELVHGQGSFVNVHKLELNSD